MTNHRRNRRLAPTILLAASAARACRTDKPQPTPTPTPTAIATPPGVPAQNLREVDWESPAVLDDLRKHFNGGEVEQKRVAYADLTGEAKKTPSSSSIRDVFLRSRHKLRHGLTRDPEVCRHLRRGAALGKVSRFDGTPHQKVRRATHALCPAASIVGW